MASIMISQFSSSLLSMLVEIFDKVTSILSCDILSLPTALLRFFSIDCTPFSTNSFFISQRITFLPIEAQT